MRYFLYELKRNLTSKFTLVVFLAMTLFLLLHIPMHMWKERTYVQNTGREMYTIADSASTFAEMAENDEDKAFYKAEQEDYSFLSKVYISKDYENSIAVKTKTEYEILQRELVRAESGKELLMPKSVEQIKQEIRWYEEMQKAELEPYATPYENNTTNFLYLIFDSNLATIVLLLLSLSIVPMIVCFDFESHTYKYVYTCEKSRMAIMLTKFAIAVVAPLLLLLVSLGITSLITTLLFGLGIKDYIYLLEQGTLISASQYIFKGLGIFIAVIFFFAALVYALSYICKKQVDAITYFALLIGIAYVFLTYRITLSFFKYIPLFYLHVENIFTNKLGISMKEAILYCLAGGLAIVLMVVFYYRKKDLLVE